MEQVLGNYSELHIPSYTRENHLIDYVRDVVQLVKERIKNIEKHHKLKSEYISTLLSLYPGNIIEYDNSKFTKATLLCELDNLYYLLVHIVLSTYLKLFVTTNTNCFISR